MRVVLFVAAGYLRAARSSTVPVATFDGAPATTVNWETVNDPIMGGQSHSMFHIDSSQRLGVWDGEVRIVSFLHAPGFCNLQSPGMFKAARFPDLGATEGLVARARDASAPGGLTNFSMMLVARGATHFMKQGVYIATFSVTSEMADHFVPWSAFRCSWRREPVAWCPDVRSQRGEIFNIGFGTSFPGATGKFTLEIESVYGQGGSIDLASFDGKATHQWHTENDPVMGGRSSSTAAVVNASGGSYLDYRGVCRIVPSLKAPGFTIAMTEAPVFGHFPDVSVMDGLTLRVRVAGGNITDFKVAFCDSRINFYRCQFASFKADFTVPLADEFQDVFVPWPRFSDKWDPATGTHTAEEPPTLASLRQITQVQIWVEGIAGAFHLQLEDIRATLAPKRSGVVPLRRQERFI